MTFSVGALYSSQEFLRLIQAGPIKQEEFRESFDRFALSSPDLVLQVCQTCNWVQLANDGTIVVTARGVVILGEAVPEKRLRHQLRDLIETAQPVWAEKMRHGRAETAKFLPGDAYQCLKEAGLLGDWTDEIRDWWDRLASAARARKSEDLLRTGRRAEKLSWEYEFKRTGVLPKWQCLESNFSGFDILSRVSSSDGTPLSIEVKGTTLNRRDATFVLTRNEWETAMSSPNYRFHLWLLKGGEVLIDLGVSDLASHVPTNNGSGAWEQTKIPYRAF